MWYGNLCSLVYSLLCKISLTSLRLIFNLSQGKSVELWCGPTCQFSLLRTEPLVSSLRSLSKPTGQRFSPSCFLKAVLLYFTFKSMTPSLWVNFSAKCHFSGGSFVIFDRSPIALVPLVSSPSSWTASGPLWRSVEHPYKSASGFSPLPLVLAPSESPNLPTSARVTMNKTKSFHFTLSNHISYSTLFAFSYTLCNNLFLSIK